MNHFDYYVAGLFMATLYAVPLLVLALIFELMDWIRGRR